MCVFGSKLKSQLVLLFSLFLLLFMNYTVLFDTIHRFYCIISADFYLYLLYFQQKVFSFSKINESQIDPQCVFGSKLKNQFILLFNFFLLLFMNPTILFGTIHESYYTISTNFYLYLLYFQQKIFSFNKISGYSSCKSVIY